MKKLVQSVGFLILALAFNLAAAQNVATFENISLSPNSFNNGSNFSGGFKSGDFYFRNNYDSSFGGFWSGIAVSNMKDDSSRGFTNQYSSITGGGWNSSNYGVYYSKGNILIEGSAKGKPVSGFYITNSTYAYYDMKEGSNFTKKFGGTSGNDPDYFKIKISGWKNGGIPADTTSEVYLADFRFSNNAEDYILKDWKWVDLTSFGTVDSITFKFYSSDTGVFGINTPLYFCIDNMGDELMSIEKQEKNINLSIYPNPARTILNIDCSEKINEIEIFNLHGSRVLQSKESVIDIEALERGIYLVQLKHNLGISVQKIIKE
jgi:hypothetical protein